MEQSKVRKSSFNLFTALVTALAFAFLVVFVLSK
jgi:hypothetical protein